MNVLIKPNKGKGKEVIYVPSEVFSEDDTTLSISSKNKTENGTQTKKKGKTAPKDLCGMAVKRLLATKSTPKKRKIQIMNWKKYHRLRVIYHFMDDLEKDFPAICTVTIIGKSVEGRDIKMLRISNSDASNTAVWMDASIHSREWITTAVVTYIADYLARNFNTLPDYITNKDWYIVPVLNPDGYEYTHTHDRMWRKNRASYGGESYGVDLNRNFSYAWGNGDAGSSDQPENVFYRGPAPFSEPESTAVRDTILGSTSQFKVFLSFHSYFQLIIFPWGHRAEPCPGYLRLLEGGTIMSRAIHDFSGMTYKVGNTKDLTYFACGTSIDWSYGIASIPYSYMIELRSRKYRFKLPRDQIPETCGEILCAVKSLMEFVDKKV